jgi:hypothetical protein
MLEDVAPGFYGIVIPENQYHASALCPRFRTVLNWKHGDIGLYPRAADAILAGHLKRCPVCFGRSRFLFKINDKVVEFLLDKYDLKVLLGMANLYEKGLPISITEIAMYSGMTYLDTNDTMKRLRRLKLVAACGFNGNVQQRRKRKFTLCGAMVVSAYNTKLYSAPLSDQELAELTPEANKKIF